MVDGGDLGLGGVRFAGGHWEGDGGAGAGRLVDGEDEFEQFAGLGTGHLRVAALAVGVDEVLDLQEVELGETGSAGFR